jgi:HEPN domain-containing protein
MPRYLLQLHRLMYTVFMSKQEGLRWIDAGKNDLTVAESLFVDNHYYAAAFFSQQSAEKSLKDLLRLHGHIAWGHNCFDLIKQFEKLLPNPINSSTISSAQRLDDHYIPSRYPDAFPSGTPADHYNKTVAGIAIKDGKAILKFVKDHKP